MSTPEKCNVRNVASWNQESSKQICSIRKQNTDQNWSGCRSTPDGAKNEKLIPDMEVTDRRLSRSIDTASTLDQTMRAPGQNVFRARFGLAEKMKMLLQHFRRSVRLRRVIVELSCFLQTRKAKNAELRSSGIVLGKLEHFETEFGKLNPIRKQETRILLPLPPLCGHHISHSWNLEIASFRLCRLRLQRFSSNSGPFAQSSDRKSGSMSIGYYSRKISLVACEVPLDMVFAWNAEHRARPPLDAHAAAASFILHRRSGDDNSISPG